jgi:hypothetical protein
MVARETPNLEVSGSSPELGFVNRFVLFPLFDYYSMLTKSGVFRFFEVFSFSKLRRHA